MFMELEKIIGMCDEALALAEESVKNGSAMDELKAIKKTEKILDEIIKTDEQIITCAKEIMKLEKTNGEYVDLKTIRELQTEILQTEQHQEQKRFELFKTAILKEAFHLILQEKTGIEFIY